MGKIIVLALLFALVIVSGAIYYSDFSKGKDITAQVVKDTSQQEIRELKRELARIKADEIEQQLREELISREEERKDVQEPQIVDPYKLEYETFDVIKGNMDFERAVILYDLNPSDIRNPIEDGQLTLINFHPEMTYKGYEELKDFLDKGGIKALVGYSADMNGLTNIRKGTGISVMILMGSDDGNGGINTITK